MNDDNDSSSVVGLPEKRLPHLYKDFFHLSTESTSDLDDDGCVSAASAPVTTAKEGLPAVTKQQQEFSTVDSGSTPETSSASSMDASACETPSPPPPTSPPLGSEYTSFVKASPSPQHRRSLNLFRTHSSHEDTAQSFYLHPPTPHVTLPSRTMCSTVPSPTPAEQGTELTVEEFEECVDSFASVNGLFMGSDHDSADDDVWRKRRRKDSFNTSKDEDDSLLMQPDLMMDAPAGIMLVFDRMLDYIDPPGGNVALREGCRDGEWQPPSSSNGCLFGGATRLLDHDDQSISTIDSLIMDFSGSGSSYPSGLLDIDHPSSSFTDSQQLANTVAASENEDDLCFFPCWADNRTVTECNDNVPTEQELPERDHSCRRSKTRRPHSIPRDLELAEEIANSSDDRDIGEAKVPIQASGTTFPQVPTTSSLASNNQTQNVYVSDESCDTQVNDPDLENTRKRSLSDIQDAAEGKAVDNGRDDEDSLSKLLKGLDFEPPFDETDELYCKLDHTITTGGASTLSYSSFTYY